MTWKLVIVLSLIALSSAAVEKNHDFIEIEPMIVNGTDSDIASFPFIVSLQGIWNETYSYHSCGASILSRYWLLTAAHCIYGDTPDQKLVEYGTTVISNTDNGEKIAYVEQLIWHEDYDSYALSNDIGLVRLATPIEMDITDYQVRLPIQGSYVASGTPAVLAGEYCICWSFQALMKYISRMGANWNRHADQHTPSGGRLADLQQLRLRQSSPVRSFLYEYLRWSS